MEGSTQAKDAFVAIIDDMERKWNDAILKRDVASAASFQAPEFKLVIGAEGQPLQVIPRELWLSVLPRYVIHRHEITGALLAEC